MMQRNQKFRFSKRERDFFMANLSTVHFNNEDNILSEYFWKPIKS